VNGIVPLADGRRVLLGAADGTVSVWDAGTGGIERVLVTHAWQVKAVAVDPGGRLAASGSVDGEVRVFELATGDVVRSLKDSGDYGVTAISFGPGSSFVACACDDGILRLWGLDREAWKWQIRAHAGSATSVLTVPAGLVSAGTDKCVHLWDLTRGKCLHTYTGARDMVLGLASTSDGGFLFSGGRDGRILVWDRRSPEPVHQLEGHEGMIHTVIVSPDGCLAASAGEDSTVRLWTLDWEYEPLASPEVPGGSR